MINGKGKTFKPGMNVPEDFSTSLGLAEMVKVGDIEFIGEPEKIETVIEPDKKIKDKKIKVEEKVEDNKEE